MNDRFIIKAAICLVYYNIGGLATTNIERLCSGNTLPVADSKCTCPNCGEKINWFFQLPIISYILCKGRCRCCSCKIPVQSLLLEIIVFISMSLVSALCDFSPRGILLSFGGYEFIKICWIFLNGKRENDFAKEYLISLVLMTFFWLMTEFMSLMLYYS